MAEVKAANGPVSHYLCELTRDYVQRQQEAREYEVYLGGKVQAGRASMRAGVGRSNDEIEAAFAARRARVAHSA
ncbi:antitoxin of toxin-antitoxin stability system [Thalassospira sp. MCCC 1A01428]|uniref:antitoxin of toxin-antitoxin stability system n=1 Tax=Thalassospira sp. MCCC 1A01428 TaxID=1470575 RepID=UPI000A1F50F4|nr:antitoxin of toxin-antitoxin stability system [Thalassospira sp. MCCC 1A01428]